MAAQGRSEEDTGSTSLDDLEVLNFPPDVDWSTTLVLKCDPSNVPYRLADVYKDLFHVLQRNNVFSLGPTVLNYAFTVSFKSEHATESFVQYVTRRLEGGVVVKGSPAVVSRVPKRSVEVSVRWIPMEVDSKHVLEALQPYGTVVRTLSVRSKLRGWFHVYTNERRFDLLLHEGVRVAQLPFGVYVKGMLGAVHVKERKPQCLQCYNDGHEGNACKYEGCPLFVGV